MTSELQISIISVNSFNIKVSSFISVFVSTEFCHQNQLHFLIGRQFYFLELQLINSKEATVHYATVICLPGQSAATFWLRKMIIECHIRSDLSLPGARAIQKLLFQVFAGYFNKNSKTTDQSDLRNNAYHAIMPESPKITIAQI